MSDRFKWFDSPWINRALLMLILWFVQDSYSTIRSDIRALKQDVANIKDDVGNIQADMRTLQREVELIENFNIQPKK